jgi:hypothetical protein
VIGYLFAMGVLLASGENRACECSFPAITQASDSDQVRRAVLARVQKFYDWYFPMSRTQAPTPSWVVVARDSVSWFTPHLDSALVANGKAQAASRGAAMSLNFDPFVPAQKPCDRYVVGTATRMASGHYLVEVFGVCGGAKRAHPDLVADLVQSKDSWVFANFRYPKPPIDLLSLLSFLN